MRVATGADTVWAALAAAGTRRVFGIPGSHTLELFEGLRRSRIETVVPANETAGGFMALGEALATGVPGILVVVPGPGLAYALPPIAEALLDTVPMLVLTVSSRSLPTASQITAGVAKAVVVIGDPARIQDDVADAYETTMRDRPGPVVVELDAPVLARTHRRRHPPRRQSLEAEPEVDIGSLEKWLAGRERPLVIAGAGATSASAELLLLAERAMMPVWSSTSARGILPEDHPLAVTADDPQFAPAPLNRALARADGVLAIGCGLSANVTANGSAHIDPGMVFRIDADAAAVSATVAAGGQGMISDSRRAIAALVAGARHGRTGWTDRSIAEIRTEGRPAPRDGEPTFGDERTSAAELFETTRLLVPRETIVATDSGYHQLLVRRHWRVLSPRGLLVPTNGQSMGFGLAASIGASLSAGRPVIGVIGDGGLMMSPSDLRTAARRSRQLTVMVFVDRQLGLIRRQQIGRFGHAHATDVDPPDLELLARAMGARYIRYRGVGSLTGAMDDGVTLLDVPVHLPARLPAIAAAARIRASIRGLTNASRADEPRG